MEAQRTLLCIHRDPGQLLYLQQDGYRLVIASCGNEGLRLLMLQVVDAVVLEYHLGLLDGAVVASAIKQVRPDVPIVMVCDNLDLPNDALKSVDAIVVRSDGQHFLMATLHFVLSIEWSQQRQSAQRPATREPSNLLGRPRRTITRGRRSASDGRVAHFLPRTTP